MSTNKTWYHPSTTGPRFYGLYRDRAHNKEVVRVKWDTDQKSYCVTILESSDPSREGTHYFTPHECIKYGMTKLSKIEAEIKGAQFVETRKKSKKKGT